MICAVVALAAAATVLRPVSSLAEVRISPNRVLVTARAASATIHRAPFDLRIENRAGRAVLREVRGRPAPLTTGPVADPVPPGFDNPSVPTLYAPLGFLVGSESIEQNDGGLWGGNLRSGERSGTQYSARAVKRAKRSGNGVSLVISTSDPSGRRLLVRVAPVGCCAIGVYATPRPSTGVATIGDSFTSTVGEGFFGFGGRHNALDQHGNTFSSFVDEENVDGLTGLSVGGGGTSLYPNGPAAAYYPQPEFISSRGYGFLLDQPQLARFQLDDHHPSAWNVSASTARLRYVVAPGSGPRAIRS
jgi:alpha-D-xyloside xylohydrolase